MMTRKEIKQILKRLMDYAAEHRMMRLHDNVLMVLKNRLQSQQRPSYLDFSLILEAYEYLLEQQEETLIADCVKVLDYIFSQVDKTDCVISKYTWALAHYDFNKAVDIIIQHDAINTAIDLASSDRAKALAQSKQQMPSFFRLVDYLRSFYSGSVPVGYPPKSAVASDFIVIATNLREYPEISENIFNQVIEMLRETLPSGWKGAFEAVCVWYDKHQRKDWIWKIVLLVPPEKKHLFNYAAHRLEYLSSKMESLKPIEKILVVWWKLVEKSEA